MVLSRYESRYMTQIIGSRDKSVFRTSARSSSGLYETLLASTFSISREVVSLSWLFWLSASVRSMMIEE